MVDSQHEGLFDTSLGTICMELEEKKRAQLGSLIILSFLLE